MVPYLSAHQIAVQLFLDILDRVLRKKALFSKENIQKVLFNLSENEAI